jgi:hypothetical protein
MASRQVLLSKASRLGNTLGHLVWEGGSNKQAPNFIVLAVFSAGGGAGGQR